MLNILQNKLVPSNNRDLIWKPYNSESYDKFSQQIKYVPPVPSPPVKNIEKDTKVINTTNKANKAKKNVLAPLTIILIESNTFRDYEGNIKEKLVTFITTNEFSKVFGITKTSEIMSGIVNNRWNKSTALFISFLFEKGINYNNTIINYYKNSNVSNTLTIEIETHD
jgi:hypothetical protein